MADKTNIPRLNMRYGLIYTSSEVGRKIKEIKIPELDQKYFILRAESLQGENLLEFAGSQMPVMAKNAVMYEEEPIVAVIAPDYESAAIARREIAIETGEEEISEEASLYQEDYGWGNIEDFRLGWKETIKREKPAESVIKEEEKEEKAAETEADEEKSGKGEEKEDTEKEEVAAEEEKTEEEEVIIHEYKKVSTTFSLDPIKYTSFTFFSATCWSEGSSLHVMVPTQYPKLVADTVARVTGFDRRKIIIHTSQYSETSDEYLFYPAIIASITASASLSMKCPVEIKTRAINRRGAIKTKRITYLNNDLRPIAEEVVHTLDIGAYQMLEREVERHAMTGIIPSYPLQAFKASIKIEKSFNFPSFIYSSMGYSEALAATEYHSSVLAKEIGMSPYEFRLWALKDKRKFTDYLPATQMGDIKRLLTDIAMKSSFSRKWSSNDLGRSNPSLLGYTKGIGIAAGTGIAGFSTSFVTEHEYQAKLTYTQRGAIVVDTSAYSRGTAVNFWKKILKEELELPSEDSVLFSNNDHSTIDSGPKILSRFICSFSKQLQTNARKLKSLKETEKLPIAITFDVENRFFPCEFDESAYAAMAIEVMLPETSFSPKVKEVWAEYSVGLIADSAILTSSIKQLILRTLIECGMEIDSSLRINISFVRRDAEGIASVVSVTKAIVISCLSSALEQAIGKRVTLPVSAEDILHLRRKGDEN